MVHLAEDRSDEELAAGAARGGRPELEALLRRCYPRIHALCRRITADDQDALDAAQEACIAVARGIARFDGRSAFTTWLYRVTTNACLDELRRRRRRPVAYGADTVSAAATRRTDEPALDAAVADRLTVDAALAGLPEDFRAAVVLRDLCGLDYAEIAAVLGIPAGTVRSRIARGRGAVADALGNQAGRAERPTRRP